MHIIDKQLVILINIKSIFKSISNFFNKMKNSKKAIHIVGDTNLIGTLMQISKSQYMFVFI